MDQLADTGMQHQDTASDTSVNHSAVDTGSVGTQAATPQAERTFTQAELNKIVGRTREETRQDAYARARQDVDAETKRSQSSQSNSMGGMNQFTPEQIDARIEAKTKEMAHQQHMTSVANDFTGKLMAAKDKYPDIEETVSQLNLPAHAHIAYWANSLDNTADVINEIGKNPAKFANVLMLSQTAPALAQKELQRLSESIKTNQAAISSQKSVNEPLSQIKPSTVGTDSGSMTVRDLRRQSWMKA